MPIREGFYNGGAGQAGLHGLGSALSDIGARMQSERDKDKQSQRELARAEAKKRYDEASALVASGEKTPEEAAAYAGNGAKPEHFTALVPSQETAVSKLNSVLKPDTTDEEANVQMHAIAPLRRVPNVASPSPFSEPDSLEYESPIQAQVSRLLQAKRGAADDTTPITQIGESASVGPTFGQASTETEDGATPPQPLGGDVTPQHVYGRYNKRTGGMEEVGRVDSGMSAATKGQATGIEATNAAPGQGRAQKIVEDTLRPAKVETDRAVQQSHIDTETSPGNVRKAAGRSAAIEYANTRAQDNARQAGIDPGVAKSYVHGTNTGKTYLYFPPTTDKEVIKKTINQMASNPATQGSRVVNAQQASALENVQAARGDYDQFVQLVMKHVAKDYGGNLFAAPRNYLANLVRSDPEVRTAVTATFPEQIKGLRAIAGAFGRITQQEITKATGAFPSVTEPLDVLITKRGLYFDALERTENAILDNQ